MNAAKIEPVSIYLTSKRYHLISGFLQKIRRRISICVCESSLSVCSCQKVATHWIYQILCAVSIESDTNMELENG